MKEYHSQVNERRKRIHEKQIAKRHEQEELEQELMAVAK